MSGKPEHISVVIERWLCDLDQRREARERFRRKYYPEYPCEDPEPDPDGIVRARKRVDTVELLPVSVD